ncbi:MAG: hypothetical protein ACOC93_02060 [Planctomycetota bacterium]
MVNATEHKLDQSHHPRWRWFWSWVLILAGLAVFTLGCALWVYLASGQWYQASPDAFREGLRRGLGETFLRRLSIFTHPWMMLIHALVVGSIVFAPVVAAIRYRLIVATLFVLATILAGQALVLALTGAAGAGLAARTPLRRRKPFLAAVLGMVPSFAYITVATLSGIDRAAVLPLRRWLLLIPPAGAIVTAVLAAGVVMAFTRIPGLRRGAILLVEAVLVSGALLTFNAGVGADELDYALIAERVTHDESVFEPISLDRWKRLNAGQGLNPDTLVNSLRSWLENRQTALTRRCNTFLQEHPDSPRAPAVLWTLAQTQTLQLDVNALAGGLVRGLSSYTMEGSKDAWARLATGFPAQPQGALAKWRLAVLALRNHQPAVAEERLAEARRRLRGYLDRPRSAGDRLFGPRAPLPSRSYYADALAELERLDWLIRQNHVIDQARSARALADLLDANPYSRDYVAHLQDLLEIHGDTELRGNIRLAIADATADPYVRADLLLSIAEDWRADADAAIEANYRLGLLILQEPVLRLKPRNQEPAEYLQFVAQEAVDNPWKAFARQRLDWLQMRTTRPDDS